MPPNEILQTLRTLGKNKKHVERMVTAYQLYTQEVFRLSYTVGFNFLQFHHLYDPMMHFIAYDQKLYFYNQIYGHLPRVQVFTSKDLNNLLLFHVESLPQNYDCDSLFQRLFTCVKRCGWSANIENESWNNFFLLVDIFILALEPYQIPAYLLQALWNPFEYFYLTPEKTLCWRHYGTPVTLLSFQSFFSQHKFTSGECSYLRKMLGYLKQWFLEKTPTLSAHKYREEHRQSLQTAKAKVLPLPREKYKNTTPPIDFLYATTGGDMNLLCQYAKLFSAVAFPLQSPKNIFDLFLESACRYQQGSRIHCQELYQGYEDLCKNLNQDPMSSREFFNYFKNNGNYLWKRTRTKADDYKTYIVNLSYLGTDTLNIHGDIQDKESFAYPLSLMTAEVDKAIPTGATTTHCNNYQK